MSIRIYGESDDSWEIHIDGVIRGKYKSMDMADHLGCMISEMDKLKESRDAWMRAATRLHRQVAADEAESK
jgi:hypothetical protein